MTDSERKNIRQVMDNPPPIEVADYIADVKADLRAALHAEITRLAQKAMQDGAIADGPKPDIVDQFWKNVKDRREMFELMMNGLTK